MPRALNLSVEQKRVRRNENNRKSYWRKKHGTDPPAATTRIVAARHWQPAPEKSLMTRTPLTVQATALEQSPGLGAGHHLQNPLSTQSLQDHNAAYNTPPRVARLSGLGHPPLAGSDVTEHHQIPVPPASLSGQISTSIQPHPNVDPFYGVNFEQLRPFYDTNLNATLNSLNGHEPDTEKDIVYAMPSGVNSRPQVHDRRHSDVGIGVSDGGQDSAPTVPTALVSPERAHGATSCTVVKDLSAMSLAIPNGPSTHPSEFSPTVTDGTVVLCTLWRVLEKMKKRNKELAGKSST